MARTCRAIALILALNAMASNRAGLKPLATAPERLVRAYVSREFGVGRELLKRLVESAEMVPAWRQLAKEIRAQAPPNADTEYTDQHWLRVWRSIVVAKHRSQKRRMSPALEADKFGKLAKSLRSAAAAIENGPLDVLVSELLPVDVRRALGVEDDPDKAMALLRSWPSAPEVLRELESRSRRLAQAALSPSRPNRRGSESRDEDVIKRAAMRIFASSLLRDFNSVFGRPLLSVTAVITSEVFEVNKNPRDPPWEGKAFVQRLWEKCIDNVE